MKTIKEKRLLIALLESKLERLTGKRVVYKESKKRGFNPENFDWEKYSWRIARYNPKHLDPNKYNWKDFSDYVARYCPEKLDSERFNWKKDAIYVKQYAPELYKKIQRSIFLIQ